MMVEYIHKDFKDIIYTKKLCNENLPLFKRGNNAQIYTFEILVSGKKKKANEEATKRSSKRKLPRATNIFKRI